MSGGAKLRNPFPGQIGLSFTQADSPAAGSNL
jgi:hypothetical protein